MWLQWSLWEIICTEKLPNNFLGKFGEIGQKSFAPPKICLPLHLWCIQRDFERVPCAAMFSTTSQVVWHLSHEPFDSVCFRTLQYSKISARKQQLVFQGSFVANVKPLWMSTQATGGNWQLVSKARVAYTFVTSNTHDWVKCPVSFHTHG